MIGKEYKLSFLGRFLKCDECGQTFYEGFRPKVPWKIRENGKTRHWGTDGAWMCRGVSPAEPADNFNHEACEAFRKQWKQQKIFTELYQADNNVIDHPDHYCWKGEECINLIRIMCRGEEGFDGYCKGNVIKYLFREAKKNGLEDLKKARAYLDLLINYRTGKKAANEP